MFTVDVNQQYNNNTTSNPLTLNKDCFVRYSAIKFIGVGRFRIWGGGKGGPNSQQAHDVVMTSMRRNDVALTSFRRHVPTRI